MNRLSGKVLAILLLLMPLIGNAAVDILVSTDRNPVHIDESFQLIFEANGSVDENPDFSPLNVFLDVVRQSESSNISIINGSMSRAKTWTLTVMAKQTGDIQIPSIRFGSDLSPPLLIKVKKANQAQMGDQSFFVNISSDLQTNVEQAQILVTIRVFSDKSLQEISLSSLQFNHGDVVVESLGDEKSFQTKINGKPYLVIEQKAALFPQKAGPLVVQPVLALADVRVGNRTFFGDPTTKPVRARSDSLTLDISEKPKSDNVWLPAKSLTLKDEWLSDPSQFTVGEPITRVLTIDALGLTAAQLPELDIKPMSSVKMYPDQDQLNNTITVDGVRGVRQEKIAYIPSKSGVIKLPALEIPWWNTTTNEWQVAKVKEQVITVKPSETFVEQAPVVTENKTEEILDNQTNNESSNNVINNDSSNGLSSYWKWIAVFFALAWLMTLILLLKKKKNHVVEPIQQVPLKKERFNISVLKDACNKKDAKACQVALLEWARDSFDSQDFYHLADLKTFVDAGFYTEVERLQSALYSSEVVEWNSERIVDYVKSHSKANTKNNKKQKKHLKPLNLS